MPATAQPKRVASTTSLPSASATAKPALNASPAPVVSTTGPASTAGTSSWIVAVFTSAPCAPRVMTAAPAPRSRSAPAARAGWLSPVSMADRRHAEGPPQPQPVLDGRQRQLELRHEDRSAVDRVAGVVDILFLQCEARARDDDDGVLAADLIEDDGRAAGAVIVAVEDEARVDAVVRVRAAGEVAERVASQFADEADPRAEARGGHGLVRAFAAGTEAELRAKDGLAPRGQPRRAEREVRDEAPHHGDARVRHVGGDRRTVARTIHSSRKSLRSGHFPA